MINYDVLFWQDSNRQNIEIDLSRLAREPLQIEADKFYTTVLDKLIKLFYK
jgi:hypothetical protein